jgi:tetratricopeptide (TPR) repeat protein
MIFRFLALGLVAAITCTGTVRAQAPAPAKMPLPVEDDPNSDIYKKNHAQTPIDPNTLHSEPQIVDDSDLSPAHVALLDYKAGKFQEAYDALKGTDPAKLDDNTVILESRILAELKRYDEGEKLLRPRLTTANAVAIDLALGDLLLHKRSFSRAEKYYGTALQAKPNDPDIILKLVYAKVGANDLVGAEQLASQLAPLDPKNPYDDHASYYFARAALAKAAGKTGEEEDQIQAARTNYGITVTNRYLKTYLQVFGAENKSPAEEMTPAPQVPPGAK